MAIDTNSQTAASVWKLKVCVRECVYICSLWESVLAYLLVSEQDVWHPAQTPAAAAVIHFPVPLRVSALIERVCACVGVDACDGFRYQFMGGVEAGLYRQLSQLFSLNISQSNKQKTLFQGSM